ncbi:MAG TPA: TonB-dependent receptor, partial [Gammaproteobacteria bacterium]
EVFKSANTVLPSGGIGSTVNMVTTRPLNLDGTKTSFSFNGVEDTSSRAGGNPFETAFLFGTNRENWGFSFSGSYQERTNREEGTRESNWITTDLMAEQEGYFRVDASNPAYTNNNTRPDGYTFYQEPSSYLIKDNDRVRSNAQATFQWQATDEIIATFDYTYSHVDFNAEGMLFGSWLGGWETLDATINENGAFTDVVADNRAYDHTVIWQTLENENNSFGVNLDWAFSDTLSFSFDAHNSTAAVDGGELNNEIGFTTDIQGIVTHTNGGASGIGSFAYDTEFAPENYLATTARINDGYKENQLQQFQLNGEWFNIESGPVQSVQFGISRIDNEFQKAKAGAVYGAQGATAASYDDALFTRTTLGGFLDEFDPVIGTNYYYAIDPFAALNAFSTNNAGLSDADGTICCGAGSLDSNDRVTETIDSIYVQFNMATDLKRMPLDIVAGVRYEEADTESISYYPIPTTLRWDMIAGLIGVNDGSGPVDSPRYGSSSTVLPSIAFALGVTDDEVVRLSMSKTMARPDLFALSSQLDIGNADFFRPTASGGNPDLNPLISENLDISFESYYNAESYFAVNFFHKEINNFVGTRTVQGQTINGLTNPALSPLALEARACVRDWVDAGRPDPGFPGVWGSGDCVSQQALWAQSWMNEEQHAGWVALGMAAGLDVSNGYPALDPGLGVGVPADAPASCTADLGWWRCNPGYIEGTASDPLALFDVTSPYNLNSGSVNGFEVSVQHLFEGTPFGLQFNATKVSGGDVDIDRDALGEQFLLPGLGDSGNFSFFFENAKHTARIALNYRGETVAGFANYEQPLYIDERKQIDISYQYRFNNSITLFADAQNINDETTRLYVRYPEMLFLSQQHGPVYRFGVRATY